MADTIDAVDPPPPPPDEVVDVDTAPAIPVESPPPKQGCFATKSTLEKVLVIIVIIILVIAVAFIVAFLINYFFATPPEGTCLTDNCVKSASRLKSHMDESQDPCNNFYKYACQGWMQRQILAPGEEKLDMESQLEDSHYIKLKALFEAEIEKDEQEFSKKPKMFYESCLNTEQLEKLKSEPFLNVVKKIGKFPTLDASWNETDFNLQDTLVRLAKMSLMPLFQVKVKQDDRDTERNKLYVTDAKLGLGKREYYVEERDSQILSDYQQWMVNTLVLLGADVNDAEEDMEKVVDFEIELAKIMRNDVEKENFKSSYKSFDVDTLQVKLSWLQWLEFLQGMTKNADGSIGVYIGIDEIVINQEPKYFENLGPLLASTSDRVLANYLMSRLLPLTAYLGEPILAEMEKFSESVLGKEKERRWKYCVDLTTEVFAESVSRMYIDSHFSKEAKDNVAVIVDDVMKVFRDQLNDNAWMAEETKEKALMKLNGMKTKVGFPDYLYDDARLVKLYKDVSANTETFLMNMVSVMNNEASENMKRLRKSPEKEKWMIQPTSLDGHYNQENNEIVVPAAFLQPPFYSIEFPSAMNYAGVASFLGREVIHAFDPTGKLHDGSGKIKNWWTDKDEAGYESRASCFLDQWGCYKWDGLSMSGEKTLHENIAYNAGLSHSYQAYLNMIERRGSEEKRLPGMKLDNHQVFFLSYAQMWCAKYGDKAKKAFLSSSSHPPFPYRVFGTLQNSKRFSAAFDCQVGTRMNPMQKCFMW